MGFEGLVVKSPSRSLTATPTGAVVRAPPLYCNAGGRCVPTPHLFCLLGPYDVQALPRGEGCVDKCPNTMLISRIFFWSSCFLFKPHLSLLRTKGPAHYSLLFRIFSHHFCARLLSYLFSTLHLVRNEASHRQSSKSAQTESKNKSLLKKLLFNDRSDFLIVYCNIPSFALFVCLASTAVDAKQYLLCSNAYRTTAMCILLLLSFFPRKDVQVYILAEDAEGHTRGDAQYTYLLGALRGGERTTGGCR